MEYLDNIITWLSVKCAAVSPSITDDYTVDSDEITVDSDIITVDEA